MNKENDISDSDDDLNGLSPNLSKINGNNPFKSDNDYFENFSDKLQNRIDELEEIKAIAPLLLAIPKYNPFEIPAGYFDELPGIIQKRCVETKPSFSIIDWLLFNVKSRIAIPAFATIVFAIIAIYITNKNTGFPTTQLADEISIEEQLYDIDETTIIDAVTDDANDLNQNNTSENIENYLIDNNVDEGNLEYEL